MSNQSPSNQSPSNQSPSNQSPSNQSPSNETPTNTRRLTITAALIVAAGLAAGVALARPATSAPVAASADRAPTEQADTASGYGTEAAAPAAAAVADIPPAATAITIQDFDFGSPVSVAPGSIVTVTNADNAPHTLTFTDGSVDTGTVEPGASISVPVPTTPGTYTFFCAIHPAMTGQLTVTAT